MTSMILIHGIDGKINRIRIDIGWHDNTSKTEDKCEDIQVE